MGWRQREGNIGLVHLDRSMVYVCRSQDGKKDGCAVSRGRKLRGADINELYSSFVELRL
jgi:hypothetical protein